MVTATAPKRLRAKAPAATKTGKAKVLIFGNPNVGKTWTALDFPGVYFIDTEGGAKLEHYQDKLKASGGDYFGPDDGANDFDTVLEEVITLATTKHKYKTLVIDSLSKLQLNTIAQSEETLLEQGKEIAFGNEKKDSTRKTRRLIKWLDMIQMNVVLICHPRDIYENNKVIGQTFDAWVKLAHELDLILQIELMGNSRKARVKKSRLKEFPGNELIDWSYKSFSERYGKAVIEASSEAIVLATPEQVAKLDSLVALLKVEPEETAKWLEKAGAESFAQMPAAHVEACIKYLNDKLPKE